MPDIATVFKQEAARIARKELRADTSALKKAVASHRGEIAALKRRIDTLERALKAAAKRQSRSSSASAGAGESARALRFRPKGLAKLRERLGLSARECGLLLGVSGQSVYLWESSRARPGAAKLQAIAELRTLGKREAAQRLAAVSGAA
jgi:DNA-binding transcriptional regulator YiaG